jgi:hypothetical protein
VGVSFFSRLREALATSSIIRCGLKVLFGFSAYTGRWPCRTSGRRGKETPMNRCIVQTLIGLVAFYGIAFGSLEISARTNPYRIESGSVAIHGVNLYPARPF